MASLTEGLKSLTCLPTAITTNPRAEATADHTAPVIGGVLSVSPSPAPAAGGSGLLGVLWEQEFPEANTGG